MKIQEAIKSGKPFRRRSDTRLDNRWIIPLDFSIQFEDDDKDNDCHGFVHFGPEDILADDWEVKR